ncbi:MAG: MAC/perforin domain-containing protein [Lysobacter sp.]
MLITIAFEGDPDRDIALRLELTDSLHLVRERLADRAGMQPGDRFRVGNANLDSEQETETTVAELVGEGRELRVRVAPEPEPEPEPQPDPEPEPEPEPPPKPKPDTTPPPRPKVPDAAPKTAWGLDRGPIPPDLMAGLIGTIGNSTIEEPEAFALLPLEAVQALFTARRLNRGLRFGPNPQSREFGERSPLAPVTYVHEDRRPAHGAAAYSSDWLTSATASRVLHELRVRGIHVASANGGLTGFGLSSNFRQDLERLSRNEITTIHLVDEMVVPKVVLFLHPDDDLRASDALVRAIEIALSDRGGRRAQYEALHRDVFANFGYYFPCETVLGGMRMRTLQVRSEDREEQQQLVREFGFAAAADVQTDRGRAVGDVGYANYSSNLENNRHISQLRRSHIRTFGGSASLAVNEGQLAEWVRSVSMLKFWDVIESRRLIPITQFLPETLARRCDSVIDEHAGSRVTERYTVLDMRQFVAPANRELLRDLL